MFAQLRSTDSVARGRLRFNLVPTTVFSPGRVPLFAQAYKGRKWIFQMVSLHCTRILALGRSLFAHVAEAFEGAAPRLFRPMYAWANIGAPVQS
jgi:hypothetical protein